MALFFKPEKMNFLNKDIEEYSINHSEKESKVLAELNRETWLKVLNPRMLSGHFQGRILSMISKMIKPKYILEIGTYTGYSAICLSEGLQKNGEIHTIDINDELKEISERYFKKANVHNNIRLYNGDALKIINKLNIKFDLVFIDADKENYCNYFDMVIEKIPLGSYIITDNVLWSGKVLNDNNPKDIETLEIKKFNAKVKKSDRVENILLPIRDGLMLCRKIK